MKKVYIIALFTISSLVLSQENSASVEKSIFNIQTGFVGFWANNGLKLSNSIALRSEIGIEPIWLVGEGTVWHPNFRLEPRYYYNLEKRVEKGYTINNNSGNFFGIALNYRPDAVVFSNNKDLKTIESISVVPKWGIRRNLGNNFNYEAGFGIGLRHEFKYRNYGEFDIHLRIGYTF